MSAAGAGGRGGTDEEAGWQGKPSEVGGYKPGAL